jgi:hypothetical protein
MQLLGFRRMTVKRKEDGKIVKGWGKGASQRGLEWGEGNDATNATTRDEDV